tara:strand:+ start:5327 stop:6451 length:1125 start_codon:yes stop_codon:yes gene_type:complete
MKECSRCLISDSDDSEIKFDKLGVCNYCKYYDLKVRELGSNEEKRFFIQNKIEKIKLFGKNKKYDCIIGLSGGLDSSFLAYWLAENGLRPLVIHLDNGWNSELAVKNIQSICHKLNFDLHTHVIDWQEFRDMQLAYLRASVVDIEILTDHAIRAIILKMSKKHKIKYIFSGFNVSTEAVMVKGWTYKKGDFMNIKDIVTKYSSIRKFKTYPYINFCKNLYYNFFFKTEIINLLNYIDYRKEKAKEVLINKLKWKDYGGKHYESLFTKFYQAYILPKKFVIDKRKVHLSNLICSKQISKKEALDIMKIPLYSSNNELKMDREFIIKKFNLSLQEFNEIMHHPIRDHLDFKSDDRYWDMYFKFLNIFRLGNRNEDN